MCVCSLCVWGVCGVCDIYVVCICMECGVHACDVHAKSDYTCVLCARVCLGVLGRSSRARRKGCVEKRDFWKQQMVCSVQLQS